MFRSLWKWHKKRKVLAKCSGKSPFSLTFQRIRYFSEYLGSQSDVLEFSMCQMLGQTCGTRWQKKKAGVERHCFESFPKKDSNEWACLHCPAAWREFCGFRFHCSSIFKGSLPTWKIQSYSKLQQFRKWPAEIPDTLLGLTGIGNTVSKATWVQIQQAGWGCWNSLSVVI